jgi:hypothetical protein
MVYLETHVCVFLILNTYVGFDCEELMEAAAITDTVTSESSHGLRGVDQDQFTSLIIGSRIIVD